MVKQGFFYFNYFFCSFYCKYVIKATPMPNLWYSYKKCYIRPPPSPLKMQYACLLYLDRNLLQWLTETWQSWNLKNIIFQIYMLYFSVCLKLSLYEYQIFWKQLSTIYLKVLVSNDFVLIYIAVKVSISKQGWQHP